MFLEARQGERRSRDLPKNECAPDAREVVLPEILLDQVAVERGRRAEARYPVAGDDLQEILRDEAIVVVEPAALLTPRRD
jgi:hypothetical protein